MLRDDYIFVKVVHTDRRIQNQIIYRWQIYGLCFIRLAIAKLVKLKANDMIKGGDSTVDENVALDIDAFSLRFKEFFFKKNLCYFFVFSSEWAVVMVGKNLLVYM